MRVQDFFLVPGSRSTFSNADPAKWYGSDQIRIRNTAYNFYDYGYYMHL